MKNNLNEEKKKKSQVCSVRSIHINARKALRQLRIKVCMHLRQHLNIYNKSAGCGYTLQLFYDSIKAGLEAACPLGVKDKIMIFFDKRQSTLAIDAAD